MKKDVELDIRFPMTSLTKCTRLMFKPGDINGWFDIDSDPYIQPIYKCPRLMRKKYWVNYWGGFWLYSSSTYNNLVRQICSNYKGTGDYLWGIRLKKDGSVELGLCNLINKNEYEKEN